MKNNRSSFTVIYEGLSRILQTQVVVSLSYPSNANISTNKTISVVATWDTGATHSCISSNVINQLNLSPTSMSTTVDTAGGIVYSPIHIVDLLLPPSSTLINLHVLYLKNLLNTDMLIGMDVMNLGDFAISNFSNKTCFTFRQSSSGVIDFTKN